MNIQPYLSFEGRCEEALEFYKKAAGAQVEMILRFHESPEPAMSTKPGNENKIMHCSFRIGESTLMASDGDCGGKAQFGGISLTLNLKTEAEAHRYFNALSEGGSVMMPLEKTFFSPAFGVLNDRFGINWMIHVV
ncbi:VOC family protein [Solimonas fluminis]|uniref:VOC family protein n=1 Tax=Solimonas fluminis TaxID=2086571 RepID=A0A2S5TKN4_9GAMM|nr:VOC family protein [Solimonas fluminis]PPE75559.1 VOC family protein [Solimonas fluminis]